MVTSIKIEQEYVHPEPQPPLDSQSDEEANNMSDDHDGYSQNLMDLSKDDFYRCTESRHRGGIRCTYRIWKTQFHKLMMMNPQEVSWKWD